MKDQVQKQQKSQFETSLTKISNIYFPMIQRQLENNSIEMDDYSKRCVMNAISAINNTLDSKGVSWNDPQLDQSNITEILLTIASLKLNPAANPREVYFELRNVKVEKNGKEHWIKKINMEIEGDGNDAILARFGRNVKQVMQFWLVRENDHFEYPKYNGLEMTPPQWSPTGQGKVVRVVYPIIKHGDIVEYHIAERHDVIRNLLAHISNNLMNETFGIAKDRFSATAEQKREIEKKKQEILRKAESLGLDKALDDEELQKYISPAWKNPQSRESMIIRKMRNNIVKKIPKDFGNTLTEVSYELSSQRAHDDVQQEVIQYANSEIIDIEPDSETFEEVEYQTIEEIKNEPENAESEEIQGKKTEHNAPQAEQIEFTGEDVPF